MFALALPERSNPSPHHSRVMSASGAVQFAFPEPTAPSSGLPVIAEGSRVDVDCRLDAGGEWIRLTSGNWIRAADLRTEYGESEPPNCG